MITLVKLGGSLITDKTIRASFRRSEMMRIAAEVSAIFTAQSDLKLIIGHGSGSFGHFEAKQYNTIAGVATPEEWRGFANVAAVAAELNFLVSGVLREYGLPVFRVQPSASALASDGSLAYMALDTVQMALARGLLPLVYGDVAFDSVRGGTIISTEALFTYLVKHLHVGRVLLLGEVDGVYDQAGHVIPEITPRNIAAVRPALGSSGGVDVTGGMLTKVEDMLALTKAHPALNIVIMNGTIPGLLQAALSGQVVAGTRISAD